LLESDWIQAPDYKELLIRPSKCLAIARLEVNPGDSKPYKLNNPCNPWSFGPLKQKSPAGLFGGTIFALTPE